MGLFTDGFKELKKASEPLYKSPKSIQETIEIMAVAENGIFEVARNRYSKCYLFQDINYTTTNEDEQIDIFERYCKFLNSLDCNYKITVNNKNKNMAELREKVMFPKKDDGFDEYRQAYNDIIEEKILDGRQGIEQERYLTLTIERKNFEEAKAQFATLEATIHKAFNELGTEIVPLTGNQRLKILHDFYHLGNEEEFDFDIKKAKKVGADFKNDLCNGMIKFFPDSFEDESKFCKALFIKKYPSSLSDRFLNEIKEIEVYHTLWYTEHIYPGTIPNSVFSMFELKDYDFVDEYNVKDNSHERIKWKLDFYHRLFNVERRKEALEAAKDESEKLKKMITDLRD